MWDANKYKIHEKFLISCIKLLIREYQKPLILYCSKNFHFLQVFWSTKFENKQTSKQSLNEQQGNRKIKWPVFGKRENSFKRNCAWFTCKCLSKLVKLLWLLKFDQFDFLTGLYIVVHLSVDYAWMHDGQMMRFVVRTNFWNSIKVKSDLIWFIIYFLTHLIVLVLCSHQCSIRSHKNLILKCLVESNDKFRKI